MSDNKVSKTEFAATTEKLCEGLRIFKVCNKRNIQKVLIGVYLSIFLVSYGHVYSNVEFRNQESRVLGSTITALFWPLYVSTLAWEE